MIQLTFLGTGTSQGVPVIGSNHPVCLSSNPKDKRLRSSVLIKWDNRNYIIDCGPDFRQQLINNPINKLDGILLHILMLITLLALMIFDLFFSVKD